MATKMNVEWNTLAQDDQGHYGQPGSSYTIAAATVQKKGSRYRILIKDRWGSNQGYLDEQGDNDRQYRGDSLDELMRIALSAEQGRDEPDESIMTAIREAIYQAEDADEA